MPDKDKFENSVNFVAGHYRRDAFIEGEAWRRLGIGSRGFFGLGRRAAAAVVIGVVLTASACILTFVVPQIASKPDSVESVAPVRQTVAAESGDVRRIEFTDARLTDVIAEIERLYGVTVTNIPEGDYRLTLSYEGNADNLIETINRLLDINLAVE